MLSFPEEYFQGETLDGFYVDETMKTVWAAELEVLNEVVTVCARHDLQWYAAYGTLLGAVRHQGFIPWDDDIDIWMKREDYRKIVELLPKELPERYVVRGPHARAGYPQYQLYVNNADTISVEPERLQKFHGCPFYVGIDIFPLDEIPADPKCAELQRGIYSLAVLIQQTLDDGWKQCLPQGETLLKQASGYGVMEKAEQIHGISKEEVLAILWRVAEKLGAEDPDKHQLAMYLDLLKYGKVFETNWFEEVEYLPFEGFDIPVPAGYDPILKTIYRDYSMPKQVKAAHDYPCYKRQLEELRALLKKTEEG